MTRQILLSIISMTIFTCLTVVVEGCNRASLAETEARLNYKAKLAAYGCSDYNNVIVCPPKEKEDKAECSYDR